MNLTDLEILWEEAGGSAASAPTAAAIAEAESSGNPSAINQSSGASGLWQILPSAHPELAGQNLLDPLTNAKAAVQVSDQGTNFNPWEAFTSGAFKVNLPSPGGGTTVIQSLPDFVDLCLGWINHIAGNVGGPILGAGTAAEAYAAAASGQGQLTSFPQPGDVVLFPANSGSRTGHAGIYAGNGQVVSDLLGSEQLMGLQTLQNTFEGGSQPIFVSAASLGASIQAKLEDLVAGITGSSQTGVLKPIQGTTSSGVSGPAQPGSGGGSVTVGNCPTDAQGRLTYDDLDDWAIPFTGGLAKLPGTKVLGIAGRFLECGGVGKIVLTAVGAGLVIAGAAVYFHGEFPKAVPVPV